MLTFSMYVFIQAVPMLTAFVVMPITFLGVSFARGEF